jgi:hypothetical protein
MEIIIFTLHCVAWVQRDTMQRSHMNMNNGKEHKGLQPSIYGWIHKDYVRLSTISRTATPE